MHQPAEKPRESQQNANRKLRESQQKANRKPRERQQKANRKTTERPEGIDAGFARLVDTDIIRYFPWANDSPEWSGKNPYGDGNASKKIVDSIIHG